MNRQTRIRRHRRVGVVLLLPFLAWALSGIVFLVQPGYDEAYEQVPVRKYSLPRTLPVPIQPHWREIRYLRSTLGEHLIVRDQNGWQHLHAGTGEVWPLPPEQDLATLLQDAFAFNPDRYGNVVSVEGHQASTDTGVELSVNWPTLGISQNGRDTRWIDRIYSIHYLEWTGFFITDRLLGLGGLALLIYMTYTGALMAFGRQRPH